MHRKLSEFYSQRRGHSPKTIAVYLDDDTSVGLETRDLKLSADVIRSVSCIIVLTIASRNASLQHLTPDLDEMLSQVVAMSRQWGTPNSSIEFVHWILSTIQKRRRLNMC